MHFKDEIIEKAILLQINGVKQIGDKDSKMGFIFEIEEKTVRIFNKKGRKLITCTCTNGTKFCNEPTLCAHKIAAILEYIKLQRIQ